MLVTQPPKAAILPAAALEMVALSDPGMVRLANEDAVFADAALGVAILADGMGGHNAGEVASGMAIKLLASGLYKGIVHEVPHPLVFCGQPFVQAKIKALIAAANLAIFNAAQQQAQYAGMGTTLVLAWFYGRRLCVAHVGDSRLYRLRAGSLQQLTRDHSLLQDQIDSGLISIAAARDSRIRNFVTRALGVEPGVDMALGDHELQAGDTYLLCSDGLNDMLTDEEIAMVLQAYAQSTQMAAEKLIEMANNHGGHDNVSVILIRVSGESRVA